MNSTSSILALTRSIEEAQASTPPLGRWLDHAKELQRELSLRVLSLSRYLDDIPRSSYASYADALIEILKDRELTGLISELKGFDDRVHEFARRLNDQGLNEKATILEKAVAEARITIAKPGSLASAP